MTTLWIILTVVFALAESQFQVLCKLKKPDAK